MDRPRAAGQGWCLRGVNNVILVVAAAYLPVLFAVSVLGGATAPIRALLLFVFQLGII